MKKNVIYLFVVLFVLVFIISGCENIKGVNIGMDLDKQFKIRKESEIAAFTKAFEILEKII